MAAAATNMHCQRAGNTTTTANFVTRVASTGNATDANFEVICIGPR
jgi:hypothetical protein